MSVRYDDVFGCLALGQQREAVKVLASIMEIQEQLLDEGLLLGQNIGPNSTVTPSVNLVFAK